MRKSSSHVSQSKSVSNVESKKGAPVDPAAAVQAIAQATQAEVPLDKETRKEKRSLLKRASAAQINLVLTLAEQAGGTLGGISIDAAATRAEQANGARLRAASAAAKRVAQRLGDQAIVVEAAVTQRTLSAIAGLEAQSKMEEGAALVPTVAELRAAGKRRKRSVKKEAPVAGTPPLASATAAAGAAPGKVVAAGG